MFQSWKTRLEEEKDKENEVSQPSFVFVPGHIIIYLSSIILQKKCDCWPSRLQVKILLSSPKGFFFFLLFIIVLLDFLP